MTTKMQEDGRETLALSVRVTEEEVEKFETIAYNATGPHTDVTKAHVLRAAARDYMEKHQGNLVECDPLENGATRDGPSKQVTITVQKAENKALEQMAYELGDKGRKVTKSDILRAATRDYTEKFEGDTWECEPYENGQIEFPYPQLGE